MEGDPTLILYHGAGSYTTSATVDQRILDWEWEWNENYPRKLTITLDNYEAGTRNLLSSSCNVWTSGVGALAIGDKLRFYLVPTSTLVNTEVIYGKIVELEQGDDGDLKITANCYLVNLENLRMDKIVYKNYRDDMKTTHGTVGAYYAVTGLTDADILTPFVHCAFAVDDEETIIGDDYGSAQTAQSLKFYDLAFAFVAEQNALIGLKVRAALAAGQTIAVSLQEDDGTGQPSGASIASANFSSPPLGPNDFEVSFLSSSKPLDLIPGMKYWLVFHMSVNTGSSDAYLIRDDTPPYTPSSSYSHYLLGSGPWTAVSDITITASVYTTEYTDIEPEDYEFDDANNRAVLKRFPSRGFVMPQTFAIPDRGRVSYYYGTKELHEIAEILIGLDPQLTASTTGYPERPFKVFQTKGKTTADCLRELCDVFEISGGWNGYQHTLLHHYASGIHYIRIRKRKKTSDASSFTFSHGDDAVMDDEVRIIRCQLRKSIRLRPASVVVVGKSPSGLPIVAARDDRALSTSFRTKTGIPLVETVTDDNIHTLEDADKAAWAYLDSVARDVWEGSITVAGTFPDCMDLDYTGLTHGSGQIVTVNFSPLGLSAVKMKVTGVKCRPNETEIFLNNRDILLENRFAIAAHKADRLEVFAAPTDPSSTLFFSCFKDAAVTTATLYMQLCKSNGTAIDGSKRVKCTKLSNSRYNMNTYHAEFEADNGHTLDGTSLVTRIELYNAETGGSEISEYVLSTSEQFPKWTTSRIIVDFNAKIS